MIFFGIGPRLVDLVDREYHRHAGGGGMVDRLDGLRHHIVIGRNDDDRHVGHFRSASTHGRESLVARRIEERDTPPVVELHAVSADMLRDSAGLSGDHVGVAYIVEQRGLAVVDVSHHGHHRRTRHEVLLAVLLGVDRLLYLDGHELDLEPELLGHDDQSLGVEPLVDRHHQSEIHAGRYDVGHRHVHHRRQLADRNEFGHFQHVLLLFLTLHLLAQAGRHGLALVAAMLGRLELRAFRRQPGQRVLDLLLYLFVADLRLDDRFHGLALFPVAQPGFRTVLGAALRRIRAASLRLRTTVGPGRSRLILLLSYIDLILSNALALLAPAMAVLPFLFLERLHVDLAEHLGTRQAGSLLGPEQVALIGCDPLVISLALHHDRSRHSLLGPRRRSRLLGNDDRLPDRLRRLDRLDIGRRGGRR